MISQWSRQDDRSERDLPARIRTLERRQRGVAVTGIAFAAAVAAAWLVAAGPPRHVSPTLEAQSYLLRDDEGRLRAELTTEVDGEPKLWLFDERGARRVEVGLLTDGSGGVRVLDKRERIRAEVGMLDGEPFLTLRDSEGRDRAKLAVVTSGEPSLFLWDRDGRAVWSSPALPARR